MMSKLLSSQGWTITPAPPARATGWAVPVQKSMAGMGDEDGGGEQARGAQIRRGAGKRRTRRQRTGVGAVSGGGGGGAQRTLQTRRSARG